MSSQADELVRFLRVMDEAGCLEHVVLIGSWAEYVWWHAGLLEGFRPNIRTLDIDLLVRNMRRPVPEAYAVHKMVVNHERGPKKQKDAEAIERMWPHLDRDSLATVLESCTRRKRSRVDAFMAQHGLEG